MVESELDEESKKFVIDVARFPDQSNVAPLSFLDTDSELILPQLSLVK